MELTLDDGTKVGIAPAGYLYNMPNQDDCFIDIQSIPDSQNQVRLGTNFLKNFYVGLDFESNKIMLGLNKESTNGKLNGHSTKPSDPIHPSIKPERHYDNKTHDGIMKVMVGMIVVMFIVAIGFLIRAKRNQKRRVVFAPTVARGGEEKKDEVAKKDEVVKTSINEDPETTLLDK